MAEKSRTTYPRDLAVRILTRVLSGGEALDEVFADVFSSQELAPATRAWLQDVCAGTLRWKGRLDLVLDSIALKKKPTGWLRKILLVGAYQLIAQDRAQPGAVVSETVDEIKKKEGEAPARFGNALLRKVADHASTWRDLPLKPGTNGKEAGQWASLPDWYWARIFKQQGVEWSQEFAKACLERPSLWVRARSADWSAEWAEPGPVPGAFRSNGAVPGVVVDREGFAQGEFFVQDISSQLLIHEISQEVKKALAGSQEPLRAWDVCAAPGGKTAGLAWNGFQVTSTDRDESRLKLLRQTVGRVAPETRVMTLEEARSLSAQDLVWVDAPCTGSGIIRRHPDVRWLRKEADLKALVALQREILRNAWEKVRPGGFLAYSVCSVFKEEGPEAIQALELQSFQLREWLLCPQNEPFGDGFWAALLRKPQ